MHARCLQMDDQEYVDFVTGEAPELPEFFAACTRRMQQEHALSEVPTSYSPVSTCSPYIVSQHTDDRCLQETLQRVQDEWQDEFGHCFPNLLEVRCMHLTDCVHNLLVVGY